MALHTVVLPIIRVSLNNEIAISVVPNSILNMYCTFQKKAFIVLSSYYVLIQSHLKFILIFY